MAAGISFLIDSNSRTRFLSLKLSADSNPCAESLAAKILEATVFSVPSSSSMNCVKLDNGLPSRQATILSTELVDIDFKRQASTSNEVAGEVSVFSEKENMTMQSGKIVEFNSAEKSKLF